MADRTLIYEIFIDRFAGPAGTQLSAPAAGDAPWQHHCGGTLDGILSRLDHVQQLGADAVYLTPIFKAESNHKYDAATYEHVDPRFGGDAAFDHLAQECRARGLGLILDGVFNHVGTGHPWFVESSAGPQSRYRAHFKWNDGKASYDCWRGHKSLPELNLQNRELQKVLFDGEDAVLRQWLRRGATGWRLDCANDLGLETCGRAVRAAHRERPVDGVVGEVMTYAEDWLSKGCLDGVMNYYFRQSVLGLGQGEVPVCQVAYNLKRVARNYRRAALLRSWNVLASHDTPRLATLIPEADRRRLMYALQFTYPGVPMIYYGEEIGMEGGHDPDCRRPMKWDAQQWCRATFAWIQRLARVRRQQPALRHGDYLPMPQPGSPTVLAFARVTNDPRQVVLVLVNASDAPYQGRVFLPYSYLFDGMKLTDLLDQQEPAWVSAGSIRLHMKPWSCVLFSPDDHISGYSFFRNSESAARDERILSNR